MDCSNQVPLLRRPGRRRPWLLAVPLIVFTVAAAALIAGWSGAGAATRAKVAPATLDTRAGLYVIGVPPGRVEVLFFSFPG